MESVLDKDNRKFLMGAAIIAVYVFHLFSVFDGPKPETALWYRILSQITANGFFGVAIFFFVSSYGLCYSFKLNDVGTFYWRRFLRIIPVYIVFMLIFSFVYPARHTVTESPIDWLNQITGLNTFRGYCNARVDWFTPALIFVYILFPLIYFIVGKSMRYRWSVLALIFLPCLFYDYFCLFFSSLFVNYMAIVVLGVFTFFVLETDKNDKYLTPFFLCVVLLSLCVTNNVQRLAMIAPLLILVLGKIDIKKNKFVRALSWIGAFSYELYLAQVITTQNLFFGIADRHTFGEFMIISLVTTPLLAMVLYIGGRVLRYVIVKTAGIFFTKSASHKKC